MSFEKATGISMIDTAFWYVEKATGISIIDTAFWYVENKYRIENHQLKNGTVDIIAYGNKQE